MKKFEKPSIKDIADFCNENNVKINPEEFYYFYEQKDWFVGKNKMVSWKAAVRTWQARVNNLNNATTNGQKICNTNTKHSYDLNAVDSYNLPKYKSKRKEQLNFFAN